MLALAAAGSVFEMDSAFIDSVFLVFSFSGSFCFALAVVRLQLAAWKQSRLWFQ